MIYLIAVSIIWALSFSLIKGVLTNLDPNFVAFARLFISLLIFLPFFRFTDLNKKYFLHFLAIGAIQYGFMYLAYIYSYQFLQAYEIAILTIFTPLFVVLLYDIWGKHFIPNNWIKALLAIIGAGIIVYSDETSVGFWMGILLVQISNVMFALGQIYYKKIMEIEKTLSSKNHYAVIFMGAVIVTFIFSLFTTNYSSLQITSEQIITLLYLGIIASGLGFFLWNIGVTKVNAGSLAVLNNLKIPLGVIVAIIFLGETVNPFQLFFGSGLIALALFVKEFPKIKTNR